MIENGVGSSDEMRYGMLGDDETTTEEKLTKYLGEIGWEYLKEHYEAGVLFFVDQRLSLEEVGVAFADDQKEVVESWLKAGDLVKIEELHAAQWEGGKQVFVALVVSPFVLCRPI